MKFLKSLTFGLLLVTMTLLAFPAVAGIGLVDCGNWGLACDGSEGAIKGYIRSMVNISLTFIALIAIIFIIIGGVRYIASQGDSKEVEQAKRTILYAVIGLIVIGLSAALVNFVVLAIGK